MADVKPKDSGPGVFVPDGMCGYLDSGGIGIAAHIRKTYLMTQSTRSASFRIMALAACLFITFGSVATKLVGIMLTSPAVAGAEGSGGAGLSSARGDIVDRNGELYATDVKVCTLKGFPRHVWTPADTARRLHEHVPSRSYDDLFRRLTSNRHEITLARNLDLATCASIHAEGIAGVSYTTGIGRSYPQRRQAAHVLGYVDVDNNGIAGVELSLEQDILQARLLRRPLELSLDSRVQFLLRAELAKSMKKFAARGAAGVVMDVHSGEVIAMTSLPDFDPNKPVTDRTARFNSATKGVYELGSVFKVFTVAMALENRTVSLADGYDTSKPLQYGRFKIRDFHGQGRWLSVPEILMHSSNIGAAKMARDVGVMRHQQFVQSLGLLERSPIELPEVGDPSVPLNWREVRAATISFGHGIAVSPLQLSSAAASIVNGGYYVEPTIRKREVGDLEERDRVVSPATAKIMRKLLRSVVTDGTAGNANVPGYRVGGKTGTAEKSTAGGYNRRDLITSFLAVFPSEDPKFVVFVMLDEPKGTAETHWHATAGWNAAPLAGSLIKKIGPVLGINPVFEEIEPQVEVQRAAFTVR